jgi:hypothetical protein
MSSGFSVREPSNYNYDYDGRPAVDALITNWRLGSDDPLLARLIRHHPEHIPAELINVLKAEQTRSVRN